MTNEISNATRLVRQTLEQLIEKYPEVTDTQRTLLDRAAQADDELKDAIDEWSNQEPPATSKSLTEKIQLLGLPTQWWAGEEPR
jgi:hypothetical protein